MSKEERKSWEKEQRAKRILDLAENVILEKGINNITIDEIAEIAGYNKRTLYFYFSDKEDIFLAIAHRAQLKFFDYLKKALEKSKYDSKIYSIGWTFYDFALKNTEYFNLIMAYESKIHNYRLKKKETDVSEYKNRCYDTSIKYGKLVVEAIEEDMDRNMIQTNLDAKQLMLLLWGQVFGIMQIILMRKEKFRETYGMDRKTFYGQFLSMVSKGLMLDN